MRLRGGEQCAGAPIVAAGKLGWQWTEGAKIRGNVLIMNLKQCNQVIKLI